MSVIIKFFNKPKYNWFYIKNVFLNNCDLKSISVYKHLYA